MKMKAVNHKPVIRPEGTSALYGGEEVSTARKYRPHFLIPCPTLSLAKGGRNSRGPTGSPDSVYLLGGFGGGVPLREVGDE